MSSVNQRIRDSIIEHAVSLRRAQAGVQNTITKRLDRLARDLRDLAVKIDPFSTARTDLRAHRTAKLNDESRKLVRAAYSEINALMRQTNRRIGRAESTRAAQTLREHLP